ncbi:MAG: hypothetical protein NC041_10505 [Bacteroides sp.]|nr:hypothetical protein [Prevotella sp.]MCM1407831.1 hypothetical protein [Treponema brennaborense]MCM1470884.1 hypothetical protein [Bacteroides sp.]
MKYLSAAQIAKKWENERGYLRDTCLAAQDKFKLYLDYFKVPYNKK